MELVEFLRARLADEEQAALAANVKQDDPEWWVSPVRASFGVHFTVRSKRDNRPVARVQRLDGDDDEPVAILDGAAVAEHIARHDPARVLREVEANRRILNRHQLGSWHSHVLDVDVVTCQACGTLDDEWPCPDLRLLALPYADHPDFRPEWKPE